MTERERTWASVHDAIAGMSGWAVGPCQYHGHDASRRVAAVDLHDRGRHPKREAITATGPTEIAAMDALAALLAARATR